jgi:hypothetical protein
MRRLPALHAQVVDTLLTGTCRLSTRLSTGTCRLPALHAQAAGPARAGSAPVHVPLGRTTWCARHRLLAGDDARGGVILTALLLDCCL